MDWIQGLENANLVPLVQTRRGDLVEFIHRGAVSICDGDGQPVAAVGDPQTCAFLRSAAKYIQLLPLVRRGLHRQLGLSQADLAVMAASHNSENMHIERVQTLLARLGLTQESLRCGPHLPLHERSRAQMLVADEAPQAVHNNCSGKHTNMLAVCQAESWDLETYTELAHPLQQEIQGLLAELSGIPAEKMALGRDGCSVVTFGLPLIGAARTFARLMHPMGFPELQGAIQTVTAAAMAHPEMIGGSGRFDTALMQAGQGKILSKVGAAGFYAIGVAPSPAYPRGLGIAFKVADGDLNWQIRPMVAIHLLKSLGILTGEEGTLPSFFQLDLKNCRDIPIGSHEICFDLPPLSRAL